MRIREADRSGPNSHMDFGAAKLAHYDAVEPILGSLLSGTAGPFESMADIAFDITACARQHAAISNNG